LFPAIGEIKSASIFSVIIRDPTLPFYLPIASSIFVPTRAQNP